MVERIAPARRRWRSAFALAAVVPILTLLLLSVTEPSDTTLDASAGSSAPWVLWAVVSVCLCIAVGVNGGFLRGVAATVVVWSVFTAALALLFGPGCPLDMSAAPHGDAALGYLGPTETCPDGTTASTIGDAAFFLPVGGVLATAITAVAGAFGALARGLAPRRM